MSYFEHYHAGEPVTWKAHDRSNYRHESDYESDSYGKTYHSNAVVLHVSMCCEKCVQQVRKSLKNVNHVNSVDVDIRRQRVIVKGDVDPDRILRKVRKQISTATFWDNSYHEDANYSSAAYQYNRPTGSFYNYKYYENDSAEAYDYSSPTLIIDDYDYYSRSPAYEYRDSSYPSSPIYSRHDSYTYSYPSHVEYPRHNNYTYSSPSHVEYPRHNDYHLRRSYETYRYR